MVNQIARSIFENRASLIRAHPAAGRIHESFEPSEFSYPLHPGADAYYRRHEPSFLVENADFVALILSLVVTAWAMILTVGK